MPAKETVIARIKSINRN